MHLRVSLRPPLPYVPYFDMVAVSHSHPTGPLAFPRYASHRFHVRFLELTIFIGTLRTNLDPFGTYDDATLWSALKRSCLDLEIPESDAVTPTGSDDEKAGSQRRLTLDSEIEAGGANLSVGQVSIHGKIEV